MLSINDLIRGNGHYGHEINSKMAIIAGSSKLWLEQIIFFFSGHLIIFLIFMEDNKFLAHVS